MRGVGFFFAGLVTGTLILVGGFLFFYSGRIYPGIAMMDIPIGGKTLAEGERTLKEPLAKRFPAKLNLTFENRQWEIPIASIGAEVNVHKSAEAGFAYGRKGTIVGNSQAIARALLVGTSLLPVVDLKDEDVNEKLAAIAAEIDIPTEEPAITIDQQTKKITISEGKDGRQLRTSVAVGLIKDNLTHLSSAPIALPVETLPVHISREQHETTRKRAESIVTKKLHLTMDGVTVDIAGPDLVSVLNFAASFKRDKVASITAELSSRVTRNPQDALFQFEGGKVSIFRPSQDGLTLDEDQVVPVIFEALGELEATGSSELTRDLPLKILPPKVTTAEVNNLGIKEQIGRGVSYFRGSIPSRVHNIILASERVSGTLVPPGETFSFAQAVGDISAATGYQQAYIIEKGRTVLGDGGGTCQVSTTLFRAAIDAGLPVEERHAHAYRVSYYEQGGWSPGFDATVFVPTVDLKFRNDTSAHILVQAIPNPKNWTLVFELYGTKDGRKVSISKGRSWDPAPAPPDRYEDDPTLPKGVVKQVDFAAAGLKAAFDYEVTRDGQTIQKRTFYSNFRPWQAVFLRGTN